MSRPRVLFLDHTGVLGGAELFLVTLAKAYGDGSEVLLFADGPLRQRLKQETLPVSLVNGAESVLGVARGGKGAEQLLAIPGVLRMAVQVARHAKRFDVLFANTQKALVIGALASRLIRRPLVWYLHDIVTAEHFSSVNRKLSVFLGNRFASRVIANSEASKAAFVQSGGRAELVSVVYNGIDADAPLDANTTGREVRRELGINGKTVVSLFSRLAPWKGQHVLLDALAKLPDAQALLVGAPLFGDEIRYQQELKAQARALGIVDRVRFLGFRDDVPRLLLATDVVVHTSVSPEPFGRVIVEGMLAGKPVVATRAGGACEILQDGVTGRLVTPGDAKELAVVLRELLANREQATALGRAAQKAAQERFSVQAMVEGVEREIRKALGDPPTPQAASARCGSCRVE